MKYLNKPVHYLQKDDFDANGNLINPNIPKNIPTLIMIQANFCGHCVTAKPAYQELANEMDGKVFFATIQGDGTEPGEKELGDMLNTIDKSFRGFPTYIAYHNGKRTVHKGGRSVDDLKKFISQLN
jgi:thiol-disulfide isomerase/thioredoxin